MCPCLDSCGSQQVAPAGAAWEGAHKKSSTAIVSGQVGGRCSISGWHGAMRCDVMRCGKERQTTLYVTTGGTLASRQCVVKSTAMVQHGMDGRAEQAGIWARVRSTGRAFSVQEECRPSRVLERTCWLSVCTLCM
jgi:hypothetical protein